jgi:hypothetical protein
MSTEPDEASRPKYFVNVEGTQHPWGEKTITVPQIRTLGGFEATQEIVEVNLEKNTEKTLGEHDVVTLKPGHGFGKKVEFKRG